MMVEDPSEAISVRALDVSSSLSIGSLTHLGEKMPKSSREVVPRPEKSNEQTKEGCGAYSDAYPIPGNEEGAVEGP